jgi:hypothetical protein
MQPTIHLPFSVGDIVCDDLGKEHTVIEIEPQADELGGLIWTRRLGDGIVFGTTLAQDAFKLVRKAA